MSLWLFAAGCALLVRGTEGKLDTDATHHLSSLSGPVPLAAGFISRWWANEEANFKKLQDKLAPQCAKFGLGNGSAVWNALPASDALDVSTLLEKASNMTNASLLELVLGEAKPMLIQSVMGDLSQTLPTVKGVPMPENLTTSLLGESDCLSVAKLANDLAGMETMKAKVTRVYKTLEPALAKESATRGLGGTVGLILELTAPLSRGRQLMMVSRVLKIVHPKLEWALAVVALGLLVCSKLTNAEKGILALCVVLTPTPIFEVLLLVLVPVLIHYGFRKPDFPDFPHVHPAPKGTETTGCCAKRAKNGVKKPAKVAKQKPAAHVKPAAHKKK